MCKTTNSPRNHDATTFFVNTVTKQQLELTESPNKCETYNSIFLDKSFSTVML